MISTHNRRQTIQHRHQQNKAALDALNLKSTDLVKTAIAAAILGKHEVTLRAWRVEGRGPPYFKDPDGTSVLYRIGALWAYAQKHTVDPTKTGVARIEHGAGLQDSAKSSCEVQRCLSHLGRNDFEREDDKKEESK